MGVGQPDQRVLDRRLLKIWLPVFLAFAAVVAVTSGGADGIWGAWAAGGYGLACIAVWLTRRLGPPLLLAFVGALGIPMVRPVLAGPATADMSVVVRSAHLLVRHGTPYLPVADLASWRSYDPYLPAMSVFGLPRALGLPGVLGDPRSWLFAVTAAALVAAFALTMPRRGARGGNYGRSAFEKAVFVLGSPLLAMPLSLGITDPPVTALVCLALVSSERASAKGASGDPAAAAVSRRGSDLWAVWTGLAVGTACAMKATVWPCLVVIAALFVARDGARRATRFLVTSAVSAVALVLITAPKLVADPRALYENTVAFPLGLAGRHTPAASPLPGHVLAGAGHVGHLVAVGLVVVAGLGVAVSLVLRPPRDVGAATLRLVVALVLLFTLAARGPVRILRVPCCSARVASAVAAPGAPGPVYSSGAQDRSATLAAFGTRR